MSTLLSSGEKLYVRLFLTATILIISTNISFSQTKQETVRNFFSEMAGLKSAAVSQEEIVLRYQSTEEVKTPVSVYQSSLKGFVVISGNDENHFISGYSPTGDFRKDKIPEALRALIYSYEASEISEYDESVRLKSTTEILPLLDKAGIHLDQYHHDEAGGCPSGCVATAFAQIMLYHKYPDKGVGSHCYTDPKHGELCADFGGTVFDWNNMNDEAYKKLSFQLGVAMEMAYCGSETGSYPLDPDYMQVLARNFKYYVHSGSNEPFYIINELEKERPVYVELYGEIAHSVIVDGLDHEGRFHINWGWGGDYNGYYMLYSEPIEVGVLVFGSQIRNTLFISTTPFEIERQDSLALLAINESFGGQLGWDISRPVANWPGVLVMNGRVNELSLQLDREHEGWIPVEIGDLSALRKFHLTGKIHGAIPESLYSLQQLEELIIQAEYGSTLYGELSSQIGNLTKLQTLRLNGFLQGIIPNSIGNLNQLIELNLMHNHLTGIIPEDLGNLSNLLIFSLNDNQLTGSIPTSVGNLINLISFYVYMNQLTGVVPSAIGNLTKLGSLELNNNQFEGEFPSSIKNLTDLWSLNLSNNKFTAIPNEIGCLKNLTSLDFNNNELTAIPDSIVLIRGLKSFSARSNKISYLPPDFGAWPDLIQVDVSDNLIVEFPKELCFLQKLESVNFEKNKITTVPLSMEYMNPEVVINLWNNEISVILADNILSLGNVNLAVNRLTFEDVPISNELKSGFSTQKNVLLKDSLFKARAGETLTVDIREITGMNHPGNEYYWFKYPENKDDNYKNDNDYKIESPVLSITVDETNQGDRYYCKIFNETIPSYQRLFYGELIEGPVLWVLNTDAITIEPMNDIEALELEYPEGFVLTSGEVNNGTVADREVILASPFGTRGDIIWQASADGIEWLNVSEQMINDNLNENIISFSSAELVLAPKSSAYYRCVLSEGTCDPIISDAILVQSMGSTLFDDVINVKDEPFHISVDSIEVTIPKALTDESFRLTITKLDNPPPAPDTCKMASVYDVSVSFGSVFDLPIEIKLKNRKLSELDLMKIPDYRPVYFDDKAQKWVEYNNGGLILSDSSIYFRTHHLTKLSFWEKIQNPTYTHRHFNDKVDVIYKYKSKSTEDLHYQRYQILNINNKVPKPWHTSNIDPDIDGTPYLIQDVAGYMNQVIKSFENAGFKYPANRRFIIYVSNLGEGILNELTGVSNSFGYISMSGISDGYMYLNTTFAHSSEEVQRMLAHEFMHYTQNQYFSITDGNYFFAEAHAPLADRLVWNDTELKDAEPEVFLKESLHSSDENSSIYDLLGSSWDTGTVPIGKILEKFFTNTSDANLSSTFLHYMSKLREGSKLNVAKLLTNHTWDEQALNWTWRAYLDEQVESQLKSTLGKEYDAFVRYLIEGSNKNFTILNTGEGNPYTNILENVKNNNIGTFTWRIPYAFQEVDELPETEHCQFTVPYLASKVALITNNSSEQAIIVNYQRNHDLHEEEEVYFGKYDHVNQKMILVNISDSLSYSMILDADDADAGKKFQHMAFLLFVNKRCPAAINPVRDFDTDFKLTAMPIFNINDVIYANVTDKYIHEYSDGSRRNFIITGCMSHWNKMNYSYSLGLNNFTSSKRMLNDHTYIIDATFSERMRITNGNSLPPSISEYDRKQTIVYDTNTGRMEILQVSKIEYTMGEYYDDKNKFHPAYKDRIYEETQKLVVKNIFDLELKEVSVTDKALVYETTNTQHTLRVLEELSSTIKESTLDEKGNVIDTSTRNLTGTDFSNDNVTINIWINYR